MSSHLKRVSLPTWVNGKREMSLAFLSVQNCRSIHGKGLYFLAVESKNQKSQQVLRSLGVFPNLTKDLGHSPEKSSPGGWVIMHRTFCLKLM